MEEGLPYRIQMKRISGIKRKNYTRIIFKKFSTNGNPLMMKFGQKIIVLERNRRVAKAYARAPVLTVNGSDDGFDGYRIGLNGFENPLRDPKTEEVKRNIGQGCKIKMDDSGNILVKRIAKANVYVKCISDENSISNDVLKLPNGSLESDKPVKLFDMKKFQQNLNKELKRSYPDRRKLECQCISSIAFPWICSNLKFLQLEAITPRSAIDIRNRPRIPIPDEDPYSVAGSGSSGSSGNGNRERSRDKPPKLPPRDLSRDIYAGFGKGEYPEHIDELRFRQMQENRRRQNKKGEKKAEMTLIIKEAALNRYNPNQLVPNSSNPALAPLYAPLRVPPGVNGGPYGIRPPPAMVGNIMSGRPFDRNPTTWVPAAPVRNVLDYESDYSHIYGRLPFPNRGIRGYLPPPPPPPHPIGPSMYVSEWE
ncbi:unnamed protein product [Lepeophtheirus salmonis]|uniref:(salmon louse) hypothetical protein n=1 Tax=Lepeophtheirus salmonis TaxID=72036 RepID=A0A7R8HBX8_LEPSM|nr:unnamed protein product [Lepeophtheirus salmonis]CAF2996084.1 unnamed protein product [Lepeophtheirus salmonis]